MVWLMLLGCPWVEKESIADLDGDGVFALRFGGRDCDDTEPAILEPRPFYLDGDQDGFGAGEPTLACRPPEGFTATDGDCNDGAADTHPAAPESCDPIDRNCDGDPQLNALAEWFDDHDGDGFGDPSTGSTGACDAPAGTVSNPFDCDDGNALAHPSSLLTPDAVERCDGIDNDCDGLFDGDDPGLDPAEATTVFVDADGDGFGTPFATESRCPDDPGFSTNDLDCNDADDLIHPAALETCNGQDDDCNGLADSADPNNTGELLFPDTDGDSHGTAFGARPFCEDAAPGYSPFDDDCNDLDASIVSEITWYTDVDGDGFGAEAADSACFAPAGTIAIPGDCDDNEVTVNPGQAELCNGRDDDCDGVFDNDAPGTTLGFADHDGDGFGAGPPIFSCSAISELNTDCDDEDATVNPSAQERCDPDHPIDNDCDGLLDEEDPDAQIHRWYEDLDLDGLGAGDAVVQCARPLGHVPETGDCAPLDIARQYADFVVVDTPSVAQEVASIAEALAHPGRCFSGPLTVSLDTEHPQILPSEFTWNFDFNGPRNLTISGARDTPTPLVIEQTVGGEFDRLTLDNVALVDLPEPAFELLNQAEIEFTNVELRNLVSTTPLLIAAAEDPDQRLRFSATDLVVDHVEMPGLVHFDDSIEIWGEISVRGLTLSDSTFSDSVFLLRSESEEFTEASTVRIEDSQITDSTFNGSLVETHAADRVELRRSTVRNNVTERPLFCIEGTCDVPSTTILEDRSTWFAQVDGGELHWEQPSVELDRNLFEANGPTPPSAAPWLIWQHAAVETVSIGNLYLNSTPQDHLGVDIGRMVHIHTLDDREGRWYTWTSLRDRYTGVSGGLQGYGADIRVYNGLFWNLEWPQIGSQESFSALQDNVFINSPILFATGFSSLDFQRNLHHQPAATAADPWPYGDYDGDRIVYRLEGPDPWGPTSASYIRSLPLDTPLITFHPNLPVKRNIAIPRGQLAPGTDEDLVLHYLSDTLATNGQRNVEISVPWHLDTDGNGIPTAWVAFHGSTFECIGFEPFLNLENADPDHDGLSNIDEWEVGTWPCVADTDGDGTDDGADETPLDPTLP